MKYFIIILLLLINLFAIKIYAKDANVGNNGEEELEAIVEDGGASDIAKILETLASITCQSQSFLSAIFGEWSYTCIPDSALSLAAASIESLGINIITMGYTVLNPNMLNVDQYSSAEWKKFQGNCTMQQRADPNDLKLTFAMCSNVLLVAELVINSGEATIEAISAAISGDNILSAIADALALNPENTHKLHQDKKLGESGVHEDIIPIPWIITQDKDELCLSTYGLLSTNWVPIGCKYIKEPFPLSKYAGFMGEKDQHNNEFLECVGANSCYMTAVENSMTLLPISSPIIECIKQMIVKSLINPTVCSVDDLSQAINSSSQNKNAIYYFQRELRSFVYLLLVIYTIFFGIKLMFGKVESQTDIIMFVVKVIFVTYFTIGINANEGNKQKYNGMLDIAFPILFSGINSLASWVINASPSQLCTFSSEEYVNGPDLSLWDAIDCRVTYYLGINAVHDFLIENSKREKDILELDLISFSIPPYLLLLIPGIISGNIALITLALSFPILVISLAAYVVHSFAVCMICIFLLGALAVIFVPMVLFEYTSQYFKSWFKLLISFMLQPMVSVGFVVMMFAVYDYGFYKTCKYQEVKVQERDGRIRKAFFLDNRKESYGSEEEFDECKSSLGWFINNPISGAFETVTIDELKSLSTDNSTVLDYLYTVDGLFFSYIKVFFEKVKDLLLALLTACFCLYIGYYFSEQLAQFAADMTEGISVAAATLNPKKLCDTLLSAAKAAAGAAVGGGGGGSGGGAGGGGAGGSSGDSISTDGMPRGGISGDSLSISGATKTGLVGGGGSSSDSTSTDSSKKRRNDISIDSVDPKGDSDPELNKDGKRRPTINLDDGQSNKNQLAIEGDKQETRPRSNAMHKRSRVEGHKSNEQEE